MIRLLLVFKARRKAVAISSVLLVENNMTNDRCTEHTLWIA